MAIFVAGIIGRLKVRLMPFLRDEITTHDIHQVSSDLPFTGGISVGLQNGSEHLLERFFKMLAHDDGMKARSNEGRHRIEVRFPKNDSMIEFGIMVSREWDMRNDLRQG
jgi:hypothetical protein